MGKNNLELEEEYRCQETRGRFDYRAEDEAHQGTGEPVNERHRRPEEQSALWGPRGALRGDSDAFPGVHGTNNVPFT